MKKLTCILIVLFIPVVVLSQGIQQSHIEANVPDTYEGFHRILERDLLSFFSQKYAKEVNVNYELLRRASTQSGVATPKFYVWVSIFNLEKMIDSGAVRVAAIDKVSIEVTHFISQKDILKNPKTIEFIFPRVLCGDIRKRAGVIE